MCQTDIYNFFLNKRLSGIDKYYSASEVGNELSRKTNISPVSIRRQINKLYAWGFLDIFIPKGIEARYWRRRFRIKDKYLNIASDKVSCISGEKSTLYNTHKNLVG